MDIIKSKKASYDFPKCGMIMGAPKVGKSTFLAKDPKSLIVDLEVSSEEQGAYFGIDVEGGYINATSLYGKEGLYGILKYYFSDDNEEYQTVIIDHLREVTSLFSSEICKDNGAKNISDVAYGAGTSKLREKIEWFMKNLQSKATTKKRVILVGHSSDRNGEVRLDIDGKNESLVFGHLDYIGYLMRSGPDLNISFSHSSGSEYGCRNKYLANYNGVADMEQIKKISRGEA